MLGEVISGAVVLYNVYGNVTSYLVMSRNVHKVPRHVTSCHIVSREVMSRHVIMLCHVMSCHRLMSNDVMRHFTQCHFLLHYTYCEDDLVTW